ncbi:MAG TPA: hypothetical protein VKB80_34055 [Kofleriaceae bacterium]|nr:hypothetical protein [Kofleriaceae bacterium]
MDHQEAISLGATERYALGTLDDAQREAFEEHFFGCLECAEDVRAATAVMAGAGSLPAAGVETVAEAGAVVRALPRAASPAPDAAHTAAREAARVAARARRKRERLRHLRPYASALAGLAAGLCIASYQGFVVIPRLESRVDRAESLQAVPSYFLTLSRAEAPTIKVAPEERHVAVTLSRSWDRPFPSYRVELQDAQGRTVQAEKVSARSAQDGELDLLLPVAELATGSYVLVVEGEGEGGATGDGAQAPIARYSFNLDRR